LQQIGRPLRARTVEHNDAQIGPAAGCEINREDGHRLTLRRERKAHKERSINFGETFYLFET
jgi:hypothetical protein